MAESGMALIQDFITRIEKGLGSVQLILQGYQVVSEYRQQFPDCTKEIIVVASIASTSTVTVSLVRLLHLQLPPLCTPSLQTGWTTVARSTLASLLVDWGPWIGSCVLLPA